MDYQSLSIKNASPLSARKRGGEDPSQGLLPEVYLKYEDYWNAFFRDGGPWKEFTNYSKRRVVTTRYERDGRQMIETGTVTVDRAGIKKKLQEDGIIPKEGRY